MHESGQVGLYHPVRAGRNIGDKWMLCSSLGGDVVAGEMRVRTCQALRKRLARMTGRVARNLTGMGPSPQTFEAVLTFC